VALAPRIYRVRAQNFAAESDNKIHDDRVAAAYGFRGGLVPGVTVYGYMLVPVVEMAPEWLERGSVQLRLTEPFYDGDEVVVRAERSDDGSIAVRAERQDGTVCARALPRLETLR
jgi:acyl dehydratase